jgi:amidophosphoribosyltransferase
MCGIFGILSQKNEVSIDIYEALTMLQHRGQDAAGIVTFDGRFFYEKKDSGLVKDIFSQENILTLKGHSGVGHVRYPTAGSLSAQNAQPFFVNAPFGMYLVHNGNLTNTEELRKKIQAKYKRHLRTDSDSEILLNVFANALFKMQKENPDRDPKENIFEAISMTMERIHGAYSVLILIDQIGLVAFRDPHGIRPLVLGKHGKDYAFASEDIAFAPTEFTPIRDVKNGEAILIDFKGTEHSRQITDKAHTPCLFEYIYLARPDSLIDGISVYKTQLRLGQKLTKQIQDSGLHIDSVIPVPDSSRPAALELAKALGVNYREGLVKNRYVGRTFIMPDQDTREKSVRRKLNPIPLEFKGKNILLVDDSIVRGTTSKKIIEMCRAAGAEKVYMASAAPEIRHKNIYGIDIPDEKELLAHKRTKDQIQKHIGADALFYQTLKDTIAAAHEGNPDITLFETSVFNGEYITEKQ